MALARRCLGCKVIIFHGSRCSACSTTTARGYGSAWQNLSRQILLRDNYTCHYCGDLADTVDHVKPKWSGGTDDPANLVAACRSCNSSKQNK